MSDNAFYTLEGPLEASPGRQQMRAANFSGLPVLLRQRGIDPRRILERHGIDLQFIRDPDVHIECQSLVDVLEDCSTLCNDSLFGLRLAQMQNPDVFGCVTTLCRAAPTVRQAISSFVEYMPVVHSPVITLELHEGREIAELRWNVLTDLGVNDQAHLQAALLNLSFVRMLGGGAFRASYVALAVDARPKDIPEIESRLGCRFRNRANLHGLAFPRAFLDQSIASASRVMFQLLGGYLARVKAAQRGTVAARVADYVRGSLPNETCSIEQCSMQLGIPVRTLQSQLGESGQTFSDLLEHQRFELAKRYLQQEHLSLDEIAALLGYSEQSSFGRAFKRWSGSTPRRYRASREARRDRIH